MEKISEKEMEQEIARFLSEATLSFRRWMDFISDVGRCYGYQKMDVDEFLDIIPLSKRDGQYKISFLEFNEILLTASTKLIEECLAELPEEERQELTRKFEEFDKEENEGLLPDEC